MKITTIRKMAIAIGLSAVLALTVSGCLAPPRHRKPTPAKKAPPKKKPAPGKQKPGRRSGTITIGDVTYTENLTN